MRGAVVALLILFLTLPACAPESGGDSQSAASPFAQTQDQDPGNVSVELDVSPSPGSWVSTPRIVILASVLNESFSPRLDLSLVTLDGVKLIPFWGQTNMTVWAASKKSLADGLHQVSMELVNTELGTLTAYWSFGIDTVPPRVDLDPLPGIADVRVFPVRGTANDTNLQSVSVNGVPALITEGSFVAHILLWPGNNDITVQALDEAGNLGLALQQMQWLPPDPVAPSSDTFLYENGSFSVNFPTTWEVHQDYELDESTVADLVALNTSGPYQSSVAIVSRRTASIVNEGLLLSILQNSILKLGGELKLDVVSRPQIIDPPAGTTAAQFSVVQTLPAGLRVFIVVTGLWDSQVGRLWLIIGTIPVEPIEQIEDDWYAIKLALGTFDVIAPPAPPGPPPEPPTASIDRALAVTIGTIALILILFGATLYHRRKIARKPPHI